MGLADWIEGSAFAEGIRPVTLFHGTDIDVPFNVFTRCEDMSVGFHFGTAAAANARLEQISQGCDLEEACGTVVPVWCRAADPLRLDDHHTWGMDAVVGQLEDLGLVGPEAAEAILESCDEAWVYAALELAGHDAVVYVNETEDRDAGEFSVFVWRAELLKSPFATSFDPDDPRLLPQLPASRRDIEDWRSLAGRIDDAKNELREFLGMDSRGVAP